MDRKNTVILLAPIVLIIVMYAVFRLLAGSYGNTIAWYGGLFVYWLLFGAAFPLLAVGAREIVQLVRPRGMTPAVLMLAALPIIIATVGRLVFGMEYEKPSTLIAIFLVITAIGNGVFEEIFWRGLFLNQFRGSVWFGMLWPSFMFGMWHYDPGSISHPDGVVPLMVGSVFFGLLLSYMARRSGTIFWGILSHTLAGLIMVI